MRFLILSDIHGNIDALNECLKTIEKMDIDAIIWCGDYVTDFPGSHDVIEKIKSYSEKYKSYIIKGNRDQNIINYARGNKTNIKERNNLEYTFNLLSENDIKWLESLPDKIEIELGNKKIYVSHRCEDGDIKDYYIKIFGHIHKQCSYYRNGVKYINPGSVGIPTDESVGAQFTILEIMDNYLKLENYLVYYDIDSLIQKLKKTLIYNDEIKWGKLLEKGVKTGIDYPLMCVEKYEKLKKEQNMSEESLELWNEIIKKYI